MIFNFEQFLLEARFSDILASVKFSDDSNTGSTINADLIINARNKKFTNDVDFIRSFNMEEFGKISMIYYEKEHNLVSRIKDRTNLKSISEFNSLLEYTVKQIISSKMDKLSNTESKYDVHLLDNDIHIIMALSKPNIYRSRKIIVVSIKSDKPDKCVGVIDIDDSEFI